MSAPGRWADEIEPRPVTWVPGCEDRIARRIVTLLAGRRDAWKTTLLVWFAKLVETAGGTVWLQSREDDVETVLRPRLDAARVDGSRVRLSNEPYEFPRDLDRWAKAAAAGNERTNGKPFDLAMIDSLQSHVPQYQRADVLLGVMDVLAHVARHEVIGVLPIGHLVKTKGSSVEAAIAGPASLQNLAKAIYLLGPEPKGEQERFRMLLEGPRDDEPVIDVLACERLGIAPKPESLAFVREFVYHPVTDRAEPMLRLAGPSPATAGQVLEAIKAETREPTQDETRVGQAAV